MNINLVKGAAAVGESTITNWDQAAIKELERFSEAKAIRANQMAAKRNAINNKVASYVDALNSNVDASSLTETQQAEVTKFLTKRRSEYAAAASEVAGLEPTNPRYLELRDVMNGVQNSFQNLAGSLKKYKEDKVNYLKDFDSKTLSEGNDLNSLDAASKIYTSEGSIQVSDNGSINFWNEENKNYDSYDSIQKPFLKDFKSADAILNLNEKVYNSGRVLSGARKKMIKQKLNRMVSQGGRQSLVSLAKDDFLMDGGLGIQDESLFEAGNEEMLKEVVLNSYMDMLSESAMQGANDKRPASGRGKTGFSGALKDEISLAQPIVNDAQEFSKISSNAYSPQQKAQLIVNAINSLNPNSRAPYVTREQFYESYLAGNQLKDSEEARAEFSNTYKDAQVFRFNGELTTPEYINIDNEQSLYDFYLSKTDLSSKARNYFRMQYQPLQPKNNTTEGSMSKYNK